MKKRRRYLCFFVSLSSHPASVFPALPIPLLFPLLVFLKLPPVLWSRLWLRGEEFDYETGRATAFKTGRRRHRQIRRFLSPVQYSGGGGDERANLGWRRRRLPCLDAERKRRITNTKGNWKRKRGAKEERRSPTASKS